MLSSDEEFLLLVNTSLLLSIKRIKEGIHQINTERGQLDEYHHLFHELKDDPARFYEYTKMTKETFEYILKKIKSRLSKNWCNLHDPIMPEERLVITLR